MKKWPPTSPITLGDRPGAGWSEGGTPIRRTTRVNEASGRETSDWLVTRIIRYGSARHIAHPAYPGGYLGTGDASLIRERGHRSNVRCTAVRPCNESGVPYVETTEAP
jgi:hypothetical protein